MQEDSKDSSLDVLPFKKDIMYKIVYENITLLLRQVLLVYRICAKNIHGYHLYSYRKSSSMLTSFVLPHFGENVCWC